MQMELLRFPYLQGCGVPHGMTLRVPGLDVGVDRQKAMRRLQGGFVDAAQRVAAGCELVTAVQVHGREVAFVDEGDRFSGPLDGVDGLLTNSDQHVLGIAVADCCPVFLWDEGGGAVGLLHAGRKGAELGILVVALEKMRGAYGSRMADVRVVLGPCIRPPHYEVDIPALLRAQAMGEGVTEAHFSDCGLDTASDLQRFYSYRMERGKTGRMMAFIASRGAGGSVVGGR